MNLLVLCDFDGTISTVDSTDLLLERHASKEWRQIEELWVNGQINTQECMKAQVELLDVSLLDINKFADNILIEKDFPEFFSFCRNNNTPLAIVSDGLDYLIKRIITNNISETVEVIANRLIKRDENKYTLQFPFAKHSCSSGCQKCHIARNLSITKNADFTIYIGDGRSDFCVAENEADLVIAKSKLLEHCKTRGINHIPFTSFSQITRILENLSKEKLSNIKEYTEYENSIAC